MRNSGNSGLYISIIIIILAVLNAIIKFQKGETIDSILWAFVAIATLLKEIRIYIAK